MRPFRPRDCPLSVMASIGPWLGMRLPKAAPPIAAWTWLCWAPRLRNSNRKLPQSGKITLMKCDLCPEDDGQGIHYHAFIEGKHHWVCEPCKKKLKVETEHTDD